MNVAMDSGELDRTLRVQYFCVVKQAKMYLVIQRMIRQKSVVQPSHEPLKRPSRKFCKRELPACRSN